jgi:hypothetical protein
VRRATLRAVAKLVSRAQIAKRRARLVKLVESLPEGSVSGDQHLSLFVKGKRYGYYLDDHHGDGRVALTCKAEPGVNRELADAEPDRFHIPAYVGPKGWLGLWLDLAEIDWVEIEELILDAYCLTAPKKLVAQVRGEDA